jgi:hypothetical protein
LVKNKGKKDYQTPVPAILFTYCAEPGTVFCLFPSVVSVPSVAKKNPNFLGEESWGLGDPKETRPSPRKDFKASDEAGRFPGLRLPTSHAFPDLSPVA